MTTRKEIKDLVHDTLEKAFYYFTDPSASESRIDDLVDILKSFDITFFHNCPPDVIDDRHERKNAFIGKVLVWAGTTLDLGVILPFYSSFHSCLNNPQ